MRRFAPSLLGSLFNGQSRLARLPVGVLRELVLCYSQWRRSRDVMSRLDENGAAGQLHTHQTLRANTIQTRST